MRRRRQPGRVEVNGDGTAVVTLLPLALNSTIANAEIQTYPAVWQSSHRICELSLINDEGCQVTDLVIE